MQKSARSAENRPLQGAHRDAPTPASSTTSRSITTAPNAAQPGRNLTLIDARTIGISPWEKEDGPVDKKRRSATPISDSSFRTGRFDPGADAALTEERRRELIRCQGGGRERQGRGEKPAARTPTTISGSAQQKAVSEDDERRAQEEIQKLTDNSSPRSTSCSRQETDLMAVDAGADPTGTFMPLYSSSTRDIRR